MHPPDKLSVNMQSQYFYQKLDPPVHPDSIEIYLDGKKQQFVVYYCISEKYLIRYKMNKLNQRVIKGDRYVAEVAKGEVKVIIK
jgi:hypothetical protein